MTATVAGIHLTGIHASRPAGNAVPDGSLYSCTTHSLIYQSSFVGNSWSTWATLGGSGSVATDTIFDAKGDLAVGTGADTSAKLTVGANHTIPMADNGQATGIKWVASQTPSTQAFSDAAAEGTADTYARGDHKHAMPASPAAGSDGYGPSTLYSPDRPPTTGTAAATDEFDDSSVDVAWGWTGTVPTHDESTFPGFLQVDSAKSITNKFRRAYVPGAATAFSIAAKVAFGVRNQDNAAWTWGIAVFDGSDNILWQMYAQTAGTTATVDNTRIVGTAGTLTGIATGASEFLYFAITRDASDVYIGYFSLNGINWNRFGSSTVATTVAKVGFTIPTNDGNGNNRTALAQFFRVYTSATTTIGK